MKKAILIALFGLVAIAVSAAQVELTSPDGQYIFTFDQRDGDMNYTLTYGGQPVVVNGRLGVNIDNHLVESAMGIPCDADTAWTHNMTLTGEERLTVDTTWVPLYGEESTIRDRYNQLVLHFTKGSANGGNATAYNKTKQYLFDIIVRAYDEGVAIRYHFPEATNGLFMHITDDLTQMQLPNGTIGWQESWAQGPFTKAPLLTSEACWQEESERPQLLRLANGYYVALCEAALIDFCRGKLRLVADNTMKFSLYDSADCITPYDMPWRVIRVGKKAVDLINGNRIMLNLNKPSVISYQFSDNTDNRMQKTENRKLKAENWIRPGKAFRVCDLKMKSALECVDFAAERGLQYIELDAGWYGPEMLMSSSALKVSEKRDIDMQRLCDYARSKGIGVWLYVNQRALYTQLDAMLPVYQRWGISGIKFGFVQIGSQQWTTWLHDAVRKCGEAHILVDIHDEYRPTGVSRMLPNLLTQEGVGGNEEMPDAVHNTTLPFTRFLCGPADYTPCYFNGRVKNTHAHQLAMPVVYYSPLTFLYWYDKPNNYKGEQELDFWKHCPTVWDESRAIDGAPGEYIVQARRAGQDWFVGVMTNTEVRTVTIRTADFLQKGKKYRVELYQDDPSLKTRSKVSTTVLIIKAGKTLTLDLQPSGGAAMRFQPLSAKR